MYLWRVETKQQSKTTTMKKQFNLQSFLTDNRGAVIAKYNNLKEEQFFSGITMKQFGLAVFTAMANNNPRSEAKAAAILPMVMGSIYNDNTVCGVSYSTPYAESNHAKMVDYHGAEKAAQLSNI